MCTAEHDLFDQVRHVRKASGVGQLCLEDGRCTEVSDTRVAEFSSGPSHVEREDDAGDAYGPRRRTTSEVGTQTDAAAAQPAQERTRQSAAGASSWQTGNQEATQAAAGVAQQPRNPAAAGEHDVQQALPEPRRQRQFARSHWPRALHQFIEDRQQRIQRSAPYIRQAFCLLHELLRRLEANACIGLLGVLGASCPDEGVIEVSNAAVGTVLLSQCCYRLRSAATTKHCRAVW